MAKKQTKAKPVATGPAIVVALIDETGSMSNRLQETIIGYNHYLAGLAEGNSNIIITSYKFDLFAGEPVIRFLDLETPILGATKLTRFNYIPRGTTPLYDAIGKAISEGVRLQTVHKSDRVTIMIQTDGAENASKEYNHFSIQQLIAAKKAAGWEIVFLGADLGREAYEFTRSIGIHDQFVTSYNSMNSSEAFGAAAANTAFYANCGATRGFSDLQKSAAGDVSFTPAVTTTVAVQTTTVVQPTPQPQPAPSVAPKATAKGSRRETV